MGEESQRVVDYEGNRNLRLSLQVLSYLLRPGSNPETVYGIPADAQIIGIGFDPDKAMVILIFDRPVPPEARFRMTQNPRSPKKFDHRQAK